MRSLSLSLAIAAVSLLPAAALAAPAMSPAGDTSQQLAQYQSPPPPGGWWEQSGRVDDLRNRYWQLSPRQRYRYDQLEQQIRGLQARQEQLRRDQRRILRWGD
ncbi:MAG TPA: hypothetical protein VJN67_02670 [Stellaceae bacterium]|nr:hypothetical protein [Stellaceae bacterium]